MAGSVNKVTLVGNLGRDPEVRSTQDGSKIVNLSIATSERWKDKNTGEQREKTEWHRVVIFNENLGRIAEQYLRKGSTCYIEGQLQTRKWTDQQGVEKYTTEVVLQRYRGELTMLDTRSGGGGGGFDAGPPEQGGGPDWGGSDNGGSGGGSGGGAGGGGGAAEAAIERGGRRCGWRAAVVVGVAVAGVLARAVAAAAEGGGRSRGDGGQLPPINGRQHRGVGILPRPPDAVDQQLPHSNRGGGEAIDSGLVQCHAALKRFIIQTNGS